MAPGWRSEAATTGSSTIGPSRDSSCARIACCRVSRSGPGSTPRSRSSGARASRYTARASACRPPRYNASMRRAWKRLPVGRLGDDAGEARGSGRRAVRQPVRRRSIAPSRRLGVRRVGRGPRDTTPSSRDPRAPTRATAPGPLDTPWRRPTIGRDPPSAIALACKPFERREIDVASVLDQPVAAACGLDPTVAQRAPQSRDVHTERVQGRRWSFLAPDLANEKSRRHGLANVQDQLGEDGALSRAGDGQPTIADADRPPAPEIRNSQAAMFDRPRRIVDAFGEGCVTRDELRVAFTPSCPPLARRLIARRDRGAHVNGSERNAPHHQPPDR